MILDRIEAVPEAVVKRSTVRTHLDHFIAQVYWNIYIYFNIFTNKLEF